MSLTCVCSKLMEHIISKHLLNHLEANNILFDKQHGFRKKRSTDTQLLAFTQYILANLSRGKQTDVIIMDFAKAFDKVPHHRLIQKLERYGITGPVNTWIETFLKERKQRVACEGMYSDWAPVINGVLQGAVIAPILFLIYINDLHNNLKSTVRPFVDDTIIYMTISNGTDATALRQDLDKLAKWEETWQMEFHPQKCSVLHITRCRNPKYKQYTLHGHILVKEDNAKYLGVVINKTLSWNNHINDVTKKANASLGFLRRNLRIGQEKIKISAYLTLVRPQLEYAAAIWDPYTQTYKNKIEMAQRPRYVCNNYNREASVTTMIKHLHWRSLQQRRTDIRLFMFIKTLHDIIALDLFPNLYPW